jgi:hypothetical protein
MTYLKELIHPATYAQVAAYQERGLRHRILTSAVMADVRTHFEKGRF